MGIPFPEHVAVESVTPESAEYNFRGGNSGRRDISHDSGLEVPPTAHKEIAGEPFGVQVFEIENYGLLEGDLDIDNVKGKIEEIEEYIFARFEEFGLKDTHASYHEVLEKIFERIGFIKNEKGMTKLDRVHNYVEMRKGVNDRQRQHDELLEKLLIPKELE